MLLDDEEIHSESDSDTHYNSKKANNKRAKGIYLHKSNVIVLIFIYLLILSR